MKANLAVNHPNPMYHETALSDCILTSMDFVAPDGGLRHKEIKKGLGSLLNHTVIDNFYHGNNASEKWDNCFESGQGREYMINMANACGNTYTTEEAKKLQFYGARWDAYQCLLSLGEACKTSFQQAMSKMYYDALALNGSGSASGSDSGSGSASGFGSGERPPSRSLF